MMFIAKMNWMSPSDWEAAIAMLRKRMAGPIAALPK
jgi:hypothetical protein